MKSCLIIPFVVIFIFKLVSCQSKAKKTEPMEKEQFSWQPGVDAPRLYPVEIYRGYFYMGDNIVGIPSGGILEDYWGGSGMNVGTGTEIPEGLKLTYLSFVENKFYTGDFPLPKDKISSLFKEGFIDYHTMKWDTYSNIIVNMAPGGVVVVWLGGIGNQVEIGKFQAEETNVNWKEFNPDGIQDRDKYVKETLGDRPEVIKNLKENGIQFGLWDTYRIKYNWKVNLILPEGCTVSTIGLEMFNGEMERLLEERLLKNEFKKRAVPSKIDVSWIEKSGQKYGADFYFDKDEAETFNAFKQIYKDNKDQEVKIILKLNERKDRFEVYLRSQSEEIELRKVHNGAYKKTR